jgi:DHA1 family bicyclomycin/chloramphenicol resistance-like MFS transporter
MNTHSNRIESTVLPSVFILAFMASLGPFGDTEYTPSLPRIAAALDVTYAHAQLTMSVYLAGFSVGQIFYGPLSDRFGRRPIILIAISTFLVGSVTCALSPNVNLLMAGRFVQALGASAGGTISNAAIRDAFPPESRTRVFLQVNAIFALAPGVGPIAGSLIDHYYGWEMNFWLLALLAVLLLLTLFFGFAETNRQPNLKAMQPREFLKNYLTLLTHPAYVSFAIIVGLAMGVVYGSLIEAPQLVMVELGYPSKMFAVVAACIVGGFVTGSLICGWLERYIADAKLIAIGLAIMLAGSLALGWIDYTNRVTLASALAAISTIYVGLAFVIPVGTSLAVAPFERIAGSASALLGSISMALASAGTLLIGQLPQDSVEAMFIAFTVLSVFGLLLAAIVNLAWGRRLK